MSRTAPLPESGRVLPCSYAAVDTHLRVTHTLPWAQLQYCRVCVYRCSIFAQATKQTLSITHLEAVHNGSSSGFRSVFYLLWCDSWLSQALDLLGFAPGCVRPPQEDSIREEWFLYDAHEAPHVQA